MGTAPEPKLVEFGGFSLDTGQRRLCDVDGKPIPLSSRAFDTLLYLLDHPGIVLDKDALMQAVWPNVIVEENNLNQAVSALRRALGEGHIVTIAGRGFQFVTPVKRLSTLASPTPVPPPDPALEALVDNYFGARYQDTRKTPSTVTQPEQSKTPTWGLRAKTTVLIATVAAAAIILLVVVALLRERVAPPQSAPAASVEPTSFQLGTVASITPITTYPGAETTPSLSPDGARVAFSWDGESGNRNIYVTQIGTGSRVKVTSSTDGQDQYPAWSPDGEYIAFLRQYNLSRFDIVVIPSLGGTERKYYTGEKLWISVDGFPLLAWTPDSRQLLFTTRRSGTDDAPSYGLHRLTLASGEVEPLALAGDMETYDTSPAVSADGAWLAFARYRRGERLNQLMVQPLDHGFTPSGEPRPVPGLDPGIYHSLTWDPSNNRLWFVNSGQILEWDVGGTVRLVNTVGPRLSMNAVAVALVRHGTTMRAAVVTPRGDMNIFALPLDPMTHEALGPPTARVLSTAIEHHPQFSPDGRRLAFVSDRSGNFAIWIADANGDNPRQITALDQFVTGFPRWSPDGTRIAFHTSAANEERVIYIVDVESGSPRRLTNGCCPGGWSADGQYLYVTEIEASNRQLRVNVEDGSREVLFDGGSAVAIESTDGGYLLYNKSRQRGYFRRSLDGDPAKNTEEQLVEDYIPSRGGLVPVADGFFYLGHTPDDQPRAFRFFDYALGRVRDMAVAPVTTGLGLTVSSDGRELLYAAIEGPPEADIMLLEFSHEHEE